jgi:hypothetical protein
MLVLAMIVLPVIILTHDSDIGSRRRGGAR